jgi:hypothetical protein
VEGQPILLAPGLPFWVYLAAVEFGYLALQRGHPACKSLLWFQEELGRFPVEVCKPDKLHHVEPTIPRFGL